jgi:hypothetical protein
MNISRLPLLRGSKERSIFPQLQPLNHLFRVMPIALRR